MAYRWSHSISLVQKHAAMQAFLPIFQHIFQAKTLLMKYPYNFFNQPVYSLQVSQAKNLEQQKRPCFEDFLEQYRSSLDIINMNSVRKHIQK